MRVPPSQTIESPEPESLTIKREVLSDPKNGQGSSPLLVVTEVPLNSTRWKYTLL